MVFPGHLRCFPQGEKIELEGGYFGKNYQCVFVCVGGGGGGTLVKRNQGINIFIIMISYRTVIMEC